MRLAALALLSLAACGASDPADSTHQGQTATPDADSPDASAAPDTIGAVDVLYPLDTASCTCAGLACGDNACGQPCGSCGPTAPYCADGQCYAKVAGPYAIITVEEGAKVIPQTNLHLSTDGDPDAISRWEWTVTQPSGSASVFLPNAQSPTPTFEVNVSGRYVFTVKSYDADGTPSEPAPSFAVDVNSPEAIHIELTWTTPGDEDQTNTGFTGFGESVGSDLDLHFLSPGAIDPASSPEGYFNSRYDCYWQNTDPNWGGTGDHDDPSLDRDDTDGAGPENVNLSAPVDGSTYRIGVHYWDDWNYGASFATIRVYLSGELAFEWVDVQLNNDELWEVATIDWPSGTVTALEAGTAGSGIPLILPNFASGF